MGWEAGGRRGSLPRAGKPLCYMEVITWTQLIPGQSLVTWADTQPGQWVLQMVEVVWNTGTLDPQRSMEERGCWFTMITGTDVTELGGTRVLPRKRLLRKMQRDCIGVLVPSHGQCGTADPRMMVPGSLSVLSLVLGLTLRSRCLN